MTPADIPFHPAVTVLDANKDGIVALEKPTGIRSHPNNTKDHSATLIRADYDFDQECYHWRNPCRPEAPLLADQSLDSPTSGILLIALNEAISREVKQQFAQHQVIKPTTRLCATVPTKTAGSGKTSFLSMLTINNLVILKPFEHKLNLNGWLLANQDPTISLLELCPITGRTHQLRRQCQLHACPILGDQTYGDFPFNRSMLKKAASKRLFLHAARIQIQYCMDTKVRKLDIHCPRPQSFNAVLGDSEAADSTNRALQLPHRRFKRS